MNNFIKTFLIILLGLGTLALLPANASTITFSGNSPWLGTIGNVRTFSADGVTVDVSADSLNWNSNWVDGYLGLYSSGLGVTNAETDNTHTVDNMGWNDRVKFIFDTSVILDSAYLRAYRDTDITVYRLVGSSWEKFEDNYGSNQSRTADVNNSGIAATGWAIGGLNPPNGIGDAFKIGNITFQAATSPTGVPESSNTLALLVIALGFTEMTRRKTAKR